MRRYLLPAFGLLSATLFADEYVGARVCAGCHREIASAQATTNMARTWHGRASSQLPDGFSQSANEGGVEYRVSGASSGFEFQTAIPGKPKFSAPVETVVGGERHGLSFLFRVGEIEGLKLARPALVEGRYLYSSPHKALLMSPGFPEEPPTTYETALGRVLSPEFERKCLACHGAAKTTESHETGVRCENCHGPAQAHLKAVADGQPRSGVLNPKRLKPAQQLDECAQCHAGFGEIEDAIPDDLLISNQVHAVQKSQCWIQSGGAFSCTACHNPHKDGGVAERSVKMCLSCHAATVANRAGLCPVNQKGDCLGCHMPVQQKSSFHMVDHWIRVHPEQRVSASHPNPEFRTKVRPRVLDIRLILTNDRASADTAHAALQDGKPFFDVARQYSKDESALSGGYVGALEPDKMAAPVAAAALSLDKGGYSGVIDLGGGRSAIVQRMPRDYLFEATEIEKEASRLRKERKFEEAAQAYTKALTIYPRFLPALVFLGVSYGELGNPARGAAVLELAARLYPADPAAHYNLGIAYEALGRGQDALREYRNAIDAQPDLIPAYLNLGGALFQMERVEEAARVYESGLQQNPLVASLYYNLAQVYARQGKDDQAVRYAKLAAVIDPQYGKRSALH